MSIKLSDLSQSYFYSPEVRPFLTIVEMPEAENRDPTST